MEFLSLQTLVFALVIILLFFAFRPSWRSALTGVQHRVALRKATMRVIVCRDDEVAVDLTSDVESGDLRAIFAILDRRTAPATRLRDRIRFWHVVAVVSLIGSIVILILSEDESNRQGAWAIIGTVVGVLIKPTVPKD